MCMFDGCDEVVTVLHERYPKARKEHRCSECRRAIEIGEVYMVERYVSDGNAFTHKTCRHCQVVRQWLLAECSGFIYECIGEDIQEQ